jgi:hypothetical protein
MYPGLMLFRPHSTAICDYEGHVVGFINPPFLSPEEQICVWRAMNELGKTATDKAGDARGNFEILTYGVQKGQGSQVSCPSGTNE